MAAVPRTTAVGAVMAPSLLYVAALSPPGPFLRILLCAPVFVIALFSLLYLTCLTDDDREAIEAVKTRFRGPR
jgi:hypothetical protein